MGISFVEKEEQKSKEERKDEKSDTKKRQKIQERGKDKSEDGERMERGTYLFQTTITNRCKTSTINNKLVNKISSK